MKLKLLKLIECRKCHKEFKLEVFKRKNSEIKDGMLICPKCKEYYFIVNFIPRILPVTLYRNIEFENRYKDKIKRIIR